MILFPRDMPEIGPAQQSFEIDRVDLLSRDASGRAGGMAVGQPLWSAEWTLGAQFGDALSDEWRAWVASLEGASRPFIGRDIERPYPKLHAGGFGGMVRVGGGAFDGSASWSFSLGFGGLPQLQLGGLPAGLTISVGDYVDFRWQTLGEARRSLVRSLERVSASGAGVAVFAVTPAVPTLTPVGAVAHLDRPGCLMRLVPQQTRLTAMDRRRAVGGRIVALQDLRP
jgi:hypothetical protein